MWQLNEKKSVSGDAEGRLLTSRRLWIISGLFGVWRRSDQELNTSQVHTQRPSTPSHFWDWKCADSFFIFNLFCMETPNPFQVLS